MDGTPICWGHEKDAPSPPPGETFIDQHRRPMRAPRIKLQMLGNRRLGGIIAATRRFGSGGLHTCALRQDGAPVCWGGGSKLLGWNMGQADPPSGEKFTAITAGGSHSCGLREDRSAVCWGNDEQGQSSVPTTEPLMAISAGGAHTCALRQNGSPVCWGDERNGWYPGKSDPPTHETFVAISSGTDHTCALRQDGTPVCWGAHERNLP